MPDDPRHQSTAWDGYPPDPERAGYHWLRRTDASIPMPAVIWTWRPEVQAWRWKGEAQMSPEEQAATKAYVAPVTDHAEVERLRANLRALMEAAEGYSAEPDAETEHALAISIACAREALDA
jgi:hypothetical protein